MLDNIRSKEAQHLTTADILNQVRKSGGYVKTSKYYYYREIANGVLYVKRLKLNEMQSLHPEVLYYERLGEEIIK